MPEKSYKKKHMTFQLLSWVCRSDPLGTKVLLMLPFSAEKDHTIS